MVADNRISSSVNIGQQTPLLGIATRDVTRLAPDDCVGEAARLMSEKRISSILITDEQARPLGIVTERSILLAMQSGLPPETALREVMAAPVVTVPESVTCLEAYQICLRDGIRHLAIVDGDGRLTGVASETDFRLHMDIAALAGQHQVAGVMARAELCLPPQTSLLDVLNLMQFRRDTCVVAVEHDRPVGIVTGRDIVRFYAHEQHASITLGQVMNAPVLTIRQGDSINEAARVMLDSRVRHLVVVDEAGCMAGLVSEHDLTHVMAHGLIRDWQSLESDFLRTMIDTLPDLVWLKDAEGAYLACNKRFEQFFGAKEQDIVGRTDYDFVDKPTADFFREHDRKAMAADKPCVNEECLTFAADGYRGPFETIKTPMRDRQGRLVGVLGIARDIAARTRVEAELRASYEKLRGLYELSSMGIALTDMQGRYLEFNDALRDICGYTREELNQLDYWALTPKEYADKEAEQLASLNTLGRYGPYEKEYIRKDGSRIPLLLNGMLIHDSDGRPYIWSMIEDVSERKKAEAVIAASEHHYRTLVENSPLCIHEIDMEGRLQSMNRAGLNMLGLVDEARIRGAFYLDAVGGQDKARIGMLMRQAFGGNTSHFEFDTDGNPPQHFKSCFIPIRDAGGKVVKLMGLTEDITGRKQAEDSLRIAAGVFAASQEAILISDADNRITDVNPAFTRVTGYAREEVLGRDPGLLASGRHDQAFYEAMRQSLEQEGHWRGEIWNRRKSGEVYAELLSISVIRDGRDKLQRYVAVFSDISYLKEHEAALDRAANYDKLTGLPNRRLLADRLSQAIARAQRDGKLLAVCYLDLDGFKHVNDEFGHEVGDQLLVNVSSRLQEALRAGDTLARLGGDEFVLLFNDFAREQECIQLIGRILDIVATPVAIGGHEVGVSASIGVTFYPADNNKDGDTLLRHADQAMYAAKQAGKNRYHLHDPAHNLRVRTLHESRQRILHGLEHGEFELFYQPKVDLASGAVAGVEALIRWHHPERGLLLPEEFLPFIDESALEIRLGEWVTDTALAQLDEWRRQGRLLEVSINISARHLLSPGFVAGLARKLERYPELPHKCLQIEVLETAALEDIARSSEVMEACHALGVHFALDDFGTGYSSLAYLRRFSAETLKIDQSFVRGMLDNEDDRAIVQIIIALAKTFGRKTVAEGIETREHYQALLEAGCEAGQGYGIARPMPARDIMELVDERR
ncbi:MAG: hypothetical protein A2Z95_02400 [Gallionellales bacterium GWA2_60_18]|nr:MAG: hypothetical protein A2Z95_02400 [Gallionellales bacterium GWA2_60_18]